MVPKNIFTLWLNDDPKTPSLIEKCIKTHFLEGYWHRVITLKNCYRSPYVDKCIQNKEWVKAVDYLRLWYLEKEGGIYLDADCEVSGNFDKFLNHRMFVFKEESSNYLFNGFIGAEAGHPWLKYVLNTMERNFRTDSEVFDSGMQFFTEAYYIADRLGLDMEIYSEKEIKDTVKHYGMESWKKS